MTRREKLMVALGGGPLWAQPSDADANFAIFEEVCRIVRDNFYDSRLRGVDWDHVKNSHFLQIRRCASADELRLLLRRILSQLGNSHLFLYSREEWNLRGNILPFYLERSGGRAYVREVLCKEGRPLTDLQAGDHLLTVDGTPAHAVRPLTLARLESIKGNPNFGVGGSVAKIEAVRAGKRIRIEAPRVKRPGGFDGVTLERHGGDILQLRFHTLEESQLPFDKLQPLWSSATGGRGLVLDFRNCVGGDPKVYAFLASSLLGPNQTLFQWIPRAGSGEGLIPRQTEDVRDRDSGRLAVIVNANTESGPELLTATLREYRRGTVFGQRSASAFNGPTSAFRLPENFALFALPYARSVSPQGLEYEGEGVRPDVAVQNSSRELAQGIDGVLLRALRFLNA